MKKNNFTSKAPKWAAGCDKRRKPMKTKHAFVIAVVVLVLFGLTMQVQAQQDNTGTNPVNFTYDFRLYAEMQSLPIDDGSLIINTVEARWPLGRDVANLKGEGAGSLFHDMGSKFGMRVRARYSNLSFATPDSDTYSVSGIGDFDARLLYLPYIGQKTIIAVGLEGFFDTATNDALGSGKTSLGPTVIGVFPGLVGRGSLFAPAYQYVFDVAGSDDRADISRSQLDLYFVWTLAAGKNWLIVDPQVIFDHENDKSPALVEAEWGFMIAPSIGVSGWIRPGVGIGSDRFYDWNLEAGIKFVWR
jgi:hypothetical protein